MMAPPPDIKLDLDANDYFIAAGSDFSTGCRENDSSMSRQNILEGVDAQEAVKRAVRKMDLVIMPIVTMFYFLSFLVCSPFVLCYIDCKSIDTAIRIAQILVCISNARGEFSVPA